MATKILPCKCDHEFQDKTHGKGRRVHNKRGGKNPNGKWKCTVCGSEQESK